MYQCVASKCRNPTSKPHPQFEKPHRHITLKYSLLFRVCFALQKFSCVFCCFWWQVTAFFNSGFLDKRDRWVIGLIWEYFLTVYLFICKFFWKLDLDWRGNNFKVNWQLCSPMQISLCVACENTERRNTICSTTTTLQYDSKLDP